MTLAVSSTSKPQLSAHFQGRRPSVIRVAQFKFFERTDGTEAVNVAIGNVSLPMHPAMIARMRRLGEPGSPFAGGVVQYTKTAGLDETHQAFLNIIASSGFGIEGLRAQITDGGSQAMEIAVLGTCGPAGSQERPLLLIDAAYTNYKAFAQRLGRATVSVTRTLQENGKFTLPPLDEIERIITERKPGALVVIPYDNPTGHYYDRETLRALARLCVKHDLWLISDEAYRELFYVDGPPSSIWGVTEDEVPGITGRRISIETSSKVWNACGLRIGALVTDNAEFNKQGVAEYTANLCANHIGQYIFGALAHESHADLRKWYGKQREYYRSMLFEFTERTRELVPGVIVSSPDAAIYSIIDVRNAVRPGFDTLEFVLYCASEGKVDLAGKPHTLLTAPMAGFYSVETGAENPGRTQMRVAYVETPERMRLVPVLFAELLKAYEAKR
jgi:aspartate aminotransferase